MSRRRGVTLAEALIAITLAVILGVLLVQLISSGVGAHRKGTQTRNAQSGTRNLVSLVTSELRSSVAAPMPQRPAISPVFWPGSWGAAQEGTPTEPFYLRDEVDLDGVQWDRSHNRLLYIRSNEQAATGVDPLEAYALVELRVPVAAPNLLERRIYPLTGAQSPLVLRDIKGADDATRQEWVLDLDRLSAQDPEVLFDSGTDSRIALRVSHRLFEPPGDPGRTRFPQLFDPSAFQIEAAVAVGSGGQPLKPWPLKAEWETWRGETSEIRIPSVRSNL